MASSLYQDPCGFSSGTTTSNGLKHAPLMVAVPLIKKFLAILLMFYILCLHPSSQRLGCLCAAKVRTIHVFRLNNEQCGRNIPFGGRNYLEKLISLIHSASFLDFCMAAIIWSYSVERVSSCGRKSM